MTTLPLKTVRLVDRATENGMTEAAALNLARRQKIPVKPGLPYGDESAMNRMFRNDYPLQNPRMDAQREKAQMKELARLLGSSLTYSEGAASDAAKSSAKRKTE